jgi:hypothetical protein
MTIRPVYTPMEGISSMPKWYAHDQLKPENRVKEVPVSKEAITSKQQLAKRYPNIGAIKWSKDCPLTYEIGKPFLPNWDI